METNDKLRDYIITLRKAQGISQDELCDYAGLSRKSWIDYETGRTNDLKSATLFRVLDRLDVTIVDMAAALGLERSIPDSAVDDVLHVACDMSEQDLHEWIQYGRYLRERK